MRRASCGADIDALTHGWWHRRNGPGTMASSSSRLAGAPAMNAITSICICSPTEMQHFIMPAELQHQIMIPPVHNTCMPSILKAMPLSLVTRAVCSQAQMLVHAVAACA